MTTPDTEARRERVDRALVEKGMCLVPSDPDPCAFPYVPLACTERRCAECFCFACPDGYQRDPLTIVNLVTGPVGPAGEPIGSEIPTAD